MKFHKPHLVHEQRITVMALIAASPAVLTSMLILWLGDYRLRLVNRAGERLLSEPAERILGAEASALGLESYLEGDAQRTIQRNFSGGTARWGISRTTFREGGLPHQLLVVTDLTRPLREEELKAW